jgi:aminotransferase
VFPNVRGVPLDADTLSARLLDEAGVATVPGSAFGEAGRAHLRLSYANSRANLEAAIERIRDFLDALG